MLIPRPVNSGVRLLIHRKVIIMTVDEIRGIFEKAKRELPSWEVVMNSTYSDEQVRDGVLFNLLKIFYAAFGLDDEVMRQPGESFEEALKHLVYSRTSYIPSREIKDIVEAALEHRSRWKK
jgi:hypothetical protein